MLDECFDLMHKIKLKSLHPVKLTLWSDGSGTILHAEVERRFGNLEVCRMLLRKLESQGFMP